MCAIQKGVVVGAGLWTEKKDISYKTVFLIFKL